MLRTIAERLSRRVMRKRRFSQTFGRAYVYVTPAAALKICWLARYLPSPDVLKIDVEGMEAAVLRGAEAVLSNQPKLLCEVYSDNQEEVAAILRRHAYIFHDSEDPKLKRVELPAYNTLALPTRPITMPLSAASRLI